MEKVNPDEQKMLIVELTQGREMTNELIKQLDPVNSRENCEALVEKILSTYEKALSMLALLGNGMVESPQSHSPAAAAAAASPISEGSNDFSKDQKCRKDVSKKRKTLPKCTEQVRVCYGTGLEGALDDGHNWRKYGQKDILGANHPRAYYRCTHRDSRGCLATKQVQKSDEDASKVKVTYKGRHSCNLAANSSLPIISIGKEMPTPKKTRLLEEDDEKIPAQQILLQHFGQGLQVETEVLKTEGENFPPFSFSSTGVESENLESQFFSEFIKENHMMGSHPPAFLSPTTSDSNYLSSSCQIDNNVGYNILQTSDSDLNDMSSTPTSVIHSSPFADLDFYTNPMEFDQSLLAYFS